MTVIPNKVSPSRYTLGVSLSEDRRCYACGRLDHPAVVRVNIDGIWTAFCEDCRSALIAFLITPSLEKFDSEGHPGGGATASVEHIDVE